MAPTTRSQAKNRTSVALKATLAKVTKTKQTVPKQPSRTVSKSACLNVTKHNKAMLNSLTDVATDVAPVANATGLSDTIPREPAHITMKTRQRTRSQHSVLRLSSGLVSLEKTPDHLIEIVQCNATQSPLLRLPGEIRNAIWEYALGGEDIEIITFQNQGRQHIHRYVLGQQDLQPAFCLPEVCRQIYSETATTAFAHNIFIFSNYGCAETFFFTLLQAQMHAITAIELSDSLRQYFQHRHGDQFPGRLLALPISLRRDPPSPPTLSLKATILPSLTHFYIAKRAECSVKVRRQIQGRWRVCGRNRRTSLEDVITEVEGKEVEVIVMED